VEAKYFIMEKNSKSFDYKQISPIKQGIVVIILILIFNLITMAGGVGPDSFFKPNIYWINNIALILVFALFNSILSIVTKDQNKYWGQSIFTFAFICIIGGLISWAFSGLTIDEAGSFRWIYVVFTMGYTILLAIVGSMRKIVSIAKKQDKRLRGER
jgi:hypothetical protein